MGLMMPNYKAMDADSLKMAAAAVGLKTNVPRRLLEHQLMTVWSKTHESDAAGPAPPHVDGAAQQLYARLRSSIRSDVELYEQILCYEVLDFEAVHRRIAAVTGVTKGQLRKFFDDEGITSTGFVG
ncbi:hypothetical protein H4R18_000855 [Coemansia javaensis]|uniref:Structure-specific endonuclease subunit SLX4 n=1 Tax=Coemansia javaensis TaxID=2761396 RepID=A0A9W8LK22_9FUNG|nr:hypothetical protein H4R18_000855 [Coemansia javaensis]